MVFLTVFRVPYLYCQLAKTSLLSAQKYCRVLIKSVNEMVNQGSQACWKQRPVRANNAEKTLAAFALRRGCEVNSCTLF